MNYEKFLPIGTVVMLKNGTKRVMITGFLTTPNDSPNVTYDYTGCLYPEGILTSEQTMVFNHDQIAQIYFLGFVDDEEKNFKQKLNEILKN